VHADNEAAFAEDYRTIARKLEVDNKLSGEELLFRVCDLIESQSRWLLILDNADDLALFGVGDTLDPTKNLAKYLPQGHGGSTLWTSRDEQIVALAGSRRGVQVGHMSDEEARKLLAMTRNEEIDMAEIHDARLLLGELQYLPLAISQAGFYLRRTSTPIKEYLSKLLKEKSRWDTLKHTEHDRYRRPGVPNNVLETWDISIKHIEQESKTAYKILHAIAYLDNQNIPLSMIYAIFTTKNEYLQREQLYEENEDSFEIAITRLKEFSLLSERKTQDDEPSFDMHKLTQEAILYKLDQEDVDSRAHFLCVAASAMMDLFARTELGETCPPGEKYVAHAIRVSDWVGVFEAEVLDDRVELRYFLIPFLSRASTWFYGRGLLRQATSIMERILNMGIKNNGEEDPANVGLMRMLALAYIQQGRYNEGEEFGLRALMLSEKIHDERNHTTVAIMQDIASLYHCRGQFKHAEKLQMKILSFLDDDHGENHLYVIEAMKGLGHLSDLQGQFNRALRFKMRALALCYEVLGKKNRVTIDIMQSLVTTYIYKKEYKKAEYLQIRILSLLRGIPGTLDMHEIVTDAMANLATIYRDKGMYEKSRKLRLRIFLLKQKLLGKKHPITMGAIMHLALAYCREGKAKLAEQLRKKALPMFFDVLGETHIRTISAMRDAAFICRNQGLFREAIELEKRATFLQQKYYGGMFPPEVLKMDDIAAKRREEAPTNRKTTVFIRRGMAASTRRRKKGSASRNMVAFIRRGMAKRRNYKQPGQ
jgi:tetratricopeptide (TPR) repeat protein